MARYAAATASLGSNAAATFDDAAAAVGYRSALTGLASLFLAGVAAVRVDPPAATIVVEVAAVSATASGRPSRPGLKLIARVHDLGRARARDGQQGEHGERQTSET
jgi:hypothetical protein